MRIVIADDEALLREGLARLLVEVGCDVVGTAGTAEELHKIVATKRPDVALVDIRMPPTHTDEGLVAAARIRETSPHVGVVVLSHHIESRYAMRRARPDRPGPSGFASPTPSSMTVSVRRSPDPTTPSPILLARLCLAAFASSSEAQK